jgi:hypothetical protein
MGASALDATLASFWDKAPRTRLRTWRELPPYFTVPYGSFRFVGVSVSRPLFPLCVAVVLPLEFPEVRMRVAFTDSSRLSYTHSYFRKL